MNKFKHHGSRGFRRNKKRLFPKGKNYAFRDNGRGKRKKSLDPALFIKKAVESYEKQYVSKHRFSDFSLHQIIQKNIVRRGYAQPTAIQDQAIQPILDNRDVVGIAHTGTGKTAAFLLPLLTKVETHPNGNVLIITPTRELAEQIQGELRLFAKGMRVCSVLCMGGSSIHIQARDIRRNPQFIIGTPGRIKDLEKRGILNFSKFRHVVLDEVDRMLDMGFIRDIKHIISLLPKERQSLFFSATIPNATKSIMENFLTNPITISVKTGKTSHNVDQDVVKINGKKKIDILHDLLNDEEFQKVLVFGRTKWGVRKVEAQLLKQGVRVASIHGNKSQPQRSRALNMLKNNKIRVLIATDVASRGLDVRDITHVINYDAPESYDDYVHRIGRTGRAGKKGVAITFID